MNINYLSIYTDKMDETIKFYTEFLGFKIERKAQPSEDVTLVFLSDDAGCNLELVDQGMEMTDPLNTSFALTIIVENINEIEKSADEFGCPKTFGPQKMPSGVTLFHVMDPNKVTINFVEMGELAK